MNKATYIFCAIAVLLCSSFRSSLDCEYANSNMGFAKAKIEEALDTNDINQARFYTYKAINALEKSKKQFEECGCSIAKKSAKEGLQVLVLATKSTSLQSTRNYLHQSMELTDHAMFLLTNHDEHDGTENEHLLVMNTDGSTVHNAPTEGAPEIEKPVVLSIHEKIDLSLEKYQFSLNKVVETVSCTEAHAFAQRIFDECERELLKPDLSEGKKYYNLRTKNITQEALDKIGNCK